MAFFMPSFISSSLNSPLSKYFSINAFIIAGNSFYQFFVQAVRFFLFLIRNRQFFRLATGILKLIHDHTQNINDLVKAGTLLPWILHHGHFISKMIFCLLHCSVKIGPSSSSLLTAKIIGVLNFSVYSQMISVPTSTPITAFSNITPVSATRKCG